MASFIAKQMVGNQLKSVKGAIGGDEDKKEEGDGEGEAGEDPEIAEARREAEERRLEKHRKMEEERETMRQEIRDKYGIKKREPPQDMMAPQEEEGGRIGRKRKTPAELAAEAEAAENEEDDLVGQFLPPNVRETFGKVTEMPGKLATEVGSKCDVQ